MLNFLAFCETPTKQVLTITGNEISGFHIFSTVIFFLAILHILFANKFTEISQKLAKRHKDKLGNAYDGEKSFVSEICVFLGEIEVVFGLWVIPLLIGITIHYNWPTAVNYLGSRVYIEPLFVIVIMAVASSKPILDLAELLIRKFAECFGGSVKAYWISLLTIGPLLGSLITEAAAMILTALLLSKHFYELKPSNKLAYATLGLLFVNISVGGVLTDFAAPPVLIVSRCWNWDVAFMMKTFGLKVLLGIGLANALYFLAFKKEFSALQRPVKKLHPIKKVPFWITGVHLLVLVWMVFNEHEIPIFMGSFLLFIGFFKATSYYQSPLNLKRPILVGFFLAGLVIHGGLQSWWITPLLKEFQDGTLMLVSAVLTAFNDNAAITFLSSLVPNLGQATKIAIVSGVIAGGGLTVIANAPNPAGQALLSVHFDHKVKPLYLFLGAVPAAIIYFFIFFLS